MPRFDLCRVSLHPNEKSQMNYFLGASDFFRRPEALLYHESVLENYCWAVHRSNIQAFFFQRLFSPLRLNDIRHSQARKAREGLLLFPV